MSSTLTLVPELDLADLDLSGLARRLPIPARARWPDVAQDTLCTRGAINLDPDAFAEQLEIDSETLKQIELGRCPPARLPPQLRKLMQMLGLPTGYSSGCRVTR